MQLVRTQMCVPSRHRQTLVPQQISDIFERGALHSEPTCERMPQVVPVKIFDPGLNHRAVKPMTAILQWLAGLRRLEHTSFSVAPAVHNPQGGHRSII